MIALPRSRSWRTAVITSLAVSAAIPLVAFALLFPLTVNMPTWDQWDMVPAWQAHFAGRSPWPLILLPQHGHLWLIPRAIFFLLGLLTHWNVRVEVVVAYLFAAATLAVFIRMLREWDPRLLVLAAPFAAVVFSFDEYEDLLTGAGLGQHLSNLSAILAIFWLTRRDPSRNRLGLAFVCAVISTLSWGAGAAVWPVGFAAILTLPPPKMRRAVVWAACAALPLFLVHYAAMTDVKPTIWSNVLPDFLILSGDPYSVSVPPAESTAFTLGIAVGTAFLALSVFGYLRAPASRELLRVWSVVALMGFTAAGSIAFARSDFDVVVLVRSHYATAVFFAGLGVMGLAVGGLLEAIDRKSGALRFAAALGVGLVCLLAVGESVVASARWYPVLKSWSVTVKSNSAKIMAGTATDEEIAASHYQTPEKVRERVEVLRRYHLAAFAEPRAIEAR